MSLNPKGMMEIIIKNYIFVVVATIAAASGILARGQGFVNLDFESANLSSYTPGLVPVTDAIPGWTALSNGLPQQTIAYNAPGLIEIVGADTIQGAYYVHLDGRRGVQVSIAQTAMIPETSRSLVFWGYSNLGTASFEGQDLSLVELEQTANYNIYGCDVSAFAGQTGQLLFSTTGTAFADIDNIQFSPSAIPEPTTAALLAIGMAVMGFWCFERLAAPFSSVNSRACKEAKCD